MEKFCWKGHASMLGANTMWGLMSPLSKLLMASGAVTSLVVTDLRIGGAMVLFWIALSFRSRSTSTIKTWLRCSLPLPLPSCSIRDASSSAWAWVHRPMLPSSPRACRCEPCCWRLSSWKNRLPARKCWALPVGRAVPCYSSLEAARTSRPLRLPAIRQYGAIC